MTNHTSADGQKDVQKKQPTPQSATSDLIPEEQLDLVDSAADLHHAQVNPASLTPAAILRLQRTVGNQAVQRLLDSKGHHPSLSKSTPTQSPLKQDTPENAYEQEQVDEMAPAALMGKMTAADPPVVQRLPVPEDAVGTPEGEIIAKMNAKTIEELKRAFHEFAVANWVYAKFSPATDGEGLLKGTSNVGDCKRLSNAFVMVATRLGFNAKKASATAGDNRWLMKPGLVTFDRQTGDYGDQWVFSSHTWVDIDGSPYDPLFHTNTGEPKVGEGIEAILIRQGGNKWQIGEGGRTIIEDFEQVPWRADTLTKMTTFAELNPNSPEGNDARTLIRQNTMGAQTFKDVKPQKKKGCYLTTACVEAQGLPDDCHELTVLRRFRDGYMKNLPEGEALIEAYYETAPLLLEKLRAEPDAAEQLEAMYRRIAAVVKTIEAGRNAEALSAYMDVALELQQRYQGSPVS